MTNAGRLARNTIYMYIRMVVLIFIGFFTSRVLLHELGIEDFGIYGLVGSIIAMFGSLRGLFVTSTQRFLNYEIGRGEQERLKLVFNTSIIVNLCISLIFTLAVEALGLYFISNGINVPESKLSTVTWVLHLSVVTSVVYIMTTPYDAVIIAHERIRAYACLSIIDHILKLLIIYLLYLHTNRLVFYAVLLFAVSLIMRAIYMVYCHSQFAECCYTFRTERDCLLKMSSFAGWQFFGNTAFALTQNGLNMILNVFGGVAVNAARSIAFQANTAINQLVVNMALVLSPYSVKSFASDNKEKMFRLFFVSSRAMFVVSVCAVQPVLFFTEPILRLWLGIVPAYSVSFLQLILVWSVLRALHSPIDTLFKSVGRIKMYQLHEGVTLALPVAFSYLALQNGCSVNVVFLLVIAFELLNLCNILRLAVGVCELQLWQYAKCVALPVTVVGLIVSTGYCITITLFADNTCYQLTTLLLTLSSTGAIMAVSATNEEKTMAGRLLKRIKRKRIWNKI